MPPPAHVFGVHPKILRLLDGGSISGGALMCAPNDSSYAAAAFTAMKPHRTANDSSYAAAAFAAMKPHRRHDSSYAAGASSGKEAASTA